MRSLSRMGVCLLIWCLLVISWDVVALAAEKTTIEWWSLGPKSAIEATIAAFEKKHPDIHVEYFMPTSHDDFWRKLMIALASGVGPDVVRSKDYFMTELAVRGALLDLTDLVERDWAELDLDKDPFYLERMRTHASFQGRQMGMPFHVWWSMFHYNERLFREAGLADPPDDWDELREYGKKLTRDTDGDGKIDQWGTMMYTYTRSEPVMVNWTFLQFLSQNGGEMIKWDDKGKPTYTLATPEGIEALQYWVDNIYQYRICTPPDLVSPNMVENERVAMWYTGHFAWGDYERLLTNVPWQVSILPQKKTRATVVEGNNAYIFKNTKNPEAAWTFLKFLISPECDLEVWANPEVGYATLPWRDRNWQVGRFTTIPRYVESIRQIRDYPAPMMELHIGLNQVQSKVAEELQAAFFGRKSPKQALQDAEKIANSMVNELYR